MTKKVKIQTTEQYVRRYCLPFVIIGFVICGSLIVFEIKDYLRLGKHIHIHDVSESIMVMIVFMFFVWLFIWFYKNDIRRKIVVNKGVKYEAKIIAFENGIGRGNGWNVHFIVQFNEDGIKRKFFSQGYNINPKIELQDRKCTIYKYKKRYIDDEYHLCLNSIDKELNIPKYKHENGLIRRKDNSFVN